MDTPFLVVVNTTVTDDSGDPLTLYVGGITPSLYMALSESQGSANVTRVESLPYDLVSGDDCAYLVGTAEAMGLVWQLTSVVTETPSGPEASPHLRVYGGEMEILAEGSWRGGEWSGGSHTSPADAAHYLTWYRARRGADTDAQS